MVKANSESVVSTVQKHAKVLRRVLTDLQVCSREVSFVVDSGRRDRVSSLQKK